MLLLAAGVQTPRYPAVDDWRERLRVCRATWLVGVSVREYRELEAGTRFPSV